MDKYKNSLVVNLAGGPGAGKSTTMAGLFSHLKIAGYNCEMAPEWIKGKVYEKTPYVLNDQIYVFAKQRKSMMQLLDTVDIIITDSPLFLSILYDHSGNKLLHDIIMHEFNRFNNFNVFLNRVKPYNPVGRYQDEAGAKKVDQDLLALMDQFNILYTKIDGDAQAVGKIVALAQLTNSLFK